MLPHPVQQLIDLTTQHEGLREYFEQQVLATPANPALAAAVKEALVTFALEKRPQYEFGPAATHPAKSSAPEAATAAEAYPAEDRLFHMIGAIILSHYSIQNPDPKAAIGENMPPFICVTTTPSGVSEIILMPFPQSAEIMKGSIDSSQLDPDMLEKLELLFDHLEEVAGDKVMLQYHREKFQFTIVSQDHLALLHLFENLMLSQSYPCRDTIHFDSTLEHNAEVPDGNKCFASRAEYIAYLGERTACDRFSAKGIADVDPDTFLTALPARPFSCFAEACRISMDYQSLCGAVPFIDISFAALEVGLCKEAGLAFDAGSAAFPLLRHH